MNEYTACELAYKNGYDKGFEEGTRHILTLFMLAERKIIDGEPKSEPVGILDMMEKTLRETKTKENK